MTPPVFGEMTIPAPRGSLEISGEKLAITFRDSCEFYAYPEIGTTLNSSGPFDHNSQASASFLNDRHLGVIPSFSDHKSVHPPTPFGKRTLHRRRRFRCIEPTTNSR